jgi:hypothetical protein
LISTGLESPRPQVDGFQAGENPHCIRCSHFKVDEVSVLEAIEDLHVTSSMTSLMVAAMLEVFFSRRAGRFKWK